MKNRVNLSFLKGQKAQRTWLLLVLVWACVRAVVIGDVFGKYGVNAWAYLIVDFGSAIPYAIYSGKVVINILSKDWSVIRKNGLLTMLFFYIPDAYVLIYAKEVPLSLLIGFFISIAIFTILAGYSLRKDVSKGGTKK